MISGIPSVQKIFDQNRNARPVREIILDLNIVVLRKMADIVCYPAGLVQFMIIFEVILSHNDRPVKWKNCPVGLKYSAVQLVIADFSRRD